MNREEIIELLLERWEQYCNETGVIKDSKRIIKGDLVSFMKWLRFNK